MPIAFINGKVYQERDRFQEAVLVVSGKIAKVGSSREILESIGAQSQVPEQTGQVPEQTGPVPEIIDLCGRTLIPGFNDSHMHLMHFGETMHQAGISEAGSIDELIEIGREHLLRHPERCEGGMKASGWNQDLFVDDKRMPNRHDLDRISTEIPIIFERVCGHIASTNTKAIEMLRLDENSPELPGGVIYREAGGYPSGIFAENNVNVVCDLIPDLTHGQKKDMLEGAMKAAAARGITSIQSNDAGFSDSGHEDFFKVMEELYAENRAPVRYRHQVAFETTEEYREKLEEGVLAPDRYGKDSLLQMGPLKLFADGSLGGRTALLSQDYADAPGQRGVEWINRETLIEFTKLATSHNVQVVAHAIGDRAICNVLDAFEHGMVEGQNLLRHTVIHCQITDRSLLERIKAMGVLTAVQPVFLDYDLHMAEARVGSELVSTSYAFGTMKKIGIHASYGTDCPVESCDPFENIYCAVTRKDREGFPEGGFYPGECVDVADAVDAYTCESAYMEFAEHRRGRIREGFDADLVVLDRDIFTCPAEQIKDIRADITMVDGKIVWSSDLSVPSPSWR